MVPKNLSSFFNNLIYIYLLQKQYQIAFSISDATVVEYVILEWIVIIYLPFWQFSSFYHPDK